MFGGAFAPHAVHFDASPNAIMRGERGPSPEALIATLISTLVAATRDHFAYSRADCICDRSSY
jgi:hypothetical protein